MLKQRETSLKLRRAYICMIFKLVKIIIFLLRRRNLTKLYVTFAHDITCVETTSFFRFCHTVRDEGAL